MASGGALERDVKVCRPVKSISLIVGLLLTMNIYLKIWKVREFKEGKGEEVEEGITV